MQSTTDVPHIVLFSMLLQYYYVIIDRGVSVPVHGIQVVYGFNTAYKMFLFQLMATVQLPNSKGYDTQMIIHSAISTADVCLAPLFQKYLSNAVCKHVVIDKVKYS